MQSFEELLAFIGPQPFPATQLTRARRFFIASFAFIAALVLVAVWGIAAGSCAGHLALANAVRVPVLLMGSSLVGLPVGLLVFRLTVRDGRASDLLLGHAGATFAAALALALLAPLVALYQYSSSWAGPVVALASAVVGALVGLLILVRTLGKLAPEPRARRNLLGPVALLCVLELAALLQIAAVAPPIFPQRTTVGHGIDALSGVESSP
jgi:hypothetical protein